MFIIKFDPVCFITEGGYINCSIRIANNVSGKQCKLLTEILASPVYLRRLSVNGKTHRQARVNVLV